MCIVGRVVPVVVPVVMSMVVPVVVSMGVPVVVSVGVPVVVAVVVPVVVTWVVLLGVPAVVHMDRSITIRKHPTDESMKKYTVAVVMMMMVLLLMMIKDPTHGRWLGAGHCLAIAGWGKPGRQFEFGASLPRGRLHYPW